MADSHGALPAREGDLPARAVSGAAAGGLRLVGVWRMRCAHVCGCSHLNAPRAFLWLPAHPCIPAPASLFRTVHPHIITLYAAWKDSRHVVLMLEYAPRGSLLQAIVAARGGCLPEREVAQHIARPLLSALAYLHSQQLIHRDIKPDNCVLAANGCLKLADFGLAIDAAAERVNTRLGTMGYLAPEVRRCAWCALPCALSFSGGGK